MHNAADHIAVEPSRYQGLFVVRLRYPNGDFADVFTGLTLEVANSAAAVLRGFITAWVAVESDAAAAKVFTGPELCWVEPSSTQGGWYDVVLYEPGTARRCFVSDHHTQGRAAAHAAAIREWLVAFQAAQVGR